MAARGDALLQTCKKELKKIVKERSGELANKPRIRLIRRTAVAPDGHRKTTKVLIHVHKGGGGYMGPLPEKSLPPLPQNRDPLSNCYCEINAILNDHPKKCGVRGWKPAPKIDPMYIYVLSHK